MARSSFPCPIDEHLCDDRKCSRSHCAEREPEAAREQRVVERSAKIDEYMAIHGVDRQWATYFVDHPGVVRFQPHTAKK